MQKLESIYLAQAISNTKIEKTGESILGLV